MRLDAIVVLGCRVHGPERLSGACSRRVARAALAYDEGMAPRVVASGGKRWGATLEARAMAEHLAMLGVPREHILREERSQTTVQNARFVAELSRTRQFRELGVVTCDWHMPRAVAAFRREGLAVHAIPAHAPPIGFSADTGRRLLERAHTFVDWVVSVGKL